MAKPEILQKGPKDAKQHTLATSAPFDTLESIAKKNAVKDGWETLALYLFGTKEADEVNRALTETVGVAKVNLAHAEKTEIKPMQGHSGKFGLPEDWTDKSFEAGKRYRLAIQHTKAPTAITITNLDKWFIPGIEANDIRFTVEGDPEAAKFVDFTVYGSNYCECTDWNKALPKFKIIENEPIFNEEGIKAPERGQNEVLNVTGADGKNAWKGQANTAKGILSVKGKDEKERFINVAFSPYTVHLRYRKTNGQKKAALQLQPFWPQFKRKETTVAVTPTYQPSQANPTSVQFAYTNADDADGGWLTVKDADGQLVWRRALVKDELQKGAKTITWDGKYDKLALNGVMQPKLVNDSALSNDDIRKKGCLFRSWPYVFELKTYKGEYLAAAEGGNPDPSLIKWKLTDAPTIERGLIQVWDKHGVIVWSQAIPKDKLANGADQELKWDGKFSAGVKNSQKGDVAIEVDMPYRVQIQVHTAETATEGLALAVMHTEVRLYVPQGQYSPKDPRRSLTDEPQAMKLSRAKCWPRKDPPASGETDLYYQYALIKAGYHSGPLSGKENDHMKRAIREFKRSVPLSVVASPGDFKRHPLATGVINNKTAEMTECLGAPDLNPRWTRKIWGDRALIDASSDAPYFVKDEDIDVRLADPKQGIVLWIDNRQYYTQVPGPGGWFHGYGPKGVDANGNVRPNGVKLAAGDPDPTNDDKEAAKDWGLRDYRGGMSIGDTAVDHDVTSISQPWVPLKVELRLLSRKDPLYPEAKDSFVNVDDEKNRQAMRRAIGPLRIDWSVHDSIYDVSTIDPTAYPAGIPPAPPPNAAAIPEIRTRRSVAHALYSARRRHQRPDEAFESQIWNCPNTDHDSGKVPDDLDKYHREVFAEGEDDSLSPWRALHDDTAEATATIVHDHLIVAKDGATAQKEDETLFEPEIGSSGIWFNPAISAGDGYRLRAEVNFKETGDYQLPNLKVLAARYPVAPQTHTCEIRLWRRSAFRGYVNWSSNAGANASRWTAATMRRVRAQYNVGHNYYVVDGYEDHTRVEKDLQVLVGNAADAATKNMLRRLVKWHDGLTWDPDVNHVDLDPVHLWPWSLRDDLGRPTLVAYAGSVGDARRGYIREFDNFWDKLTGPILYWINFRFEADGHMRGHMIVDFDSIPPAQFYNYQCNTSPGHKFLSLRLVSAGAPGATACPTCGGATTIAATGGAVDSINLAAIGLALGSSWMFRGNIDDFVHEMGHHRHMEHASSAPGPKSAQHDSAPNPDVPATATEIDGSEPDPAVPMAGGNSSLEMQWDRRCVMSYNDRDAQSLFPGNRDRPTLLFCGKCAMRIRGWKFATITNPANDVHEPN